MPDGQLVPFERQTVVPPTKRDVTASEVPVAPLKVNGPDRFMADPVAFVKFKVVRVEEPALKAPVSARVVPVPFVNVVPSSVVRPVTVRFVEVVFVPVAFVQVMFVGLKEVTLKVVAVRFEMKAFVVVVFPKTPFVTKMLDPVAFVKFNVVTVVLAAESTCEFLEGREAGDREGCNIGCPCDREVRSRDVHRGGIPVHDVDRINRSRVRDGEV